MGQINEMIMRYQRYFWIVAMAFLALLWLALALHAQEIATDPTAVVIPYGEYLSAAVPYIALVLSAVAMWSLRRLPGRWAALANEWLAIGQTARVDQLLQKAISFGVNSVAGASKDKSLTVEIANPVLREALRYALEHAPELVAKFAGTPEALGEKIWARLNVAPEVAKPDIATTAAKVTMALPADNPHAA